MKEEEGGPRCRRNGKFETNRSRGRRRRGGEERQPALHSAPSPDEVRVRGRGRGSGEKGRGVGGGDPERPRPVKPGSPPPGRRVTASVVLSRRAAAAARGSAVQSSAAARLERRRRQQASLKEKEMIVARPRGHRAPLPAPSLSRTPAQSWEGCPSASAPCAHAGRGAGSAEPVPGHCYPRLPSSHPAPPPWLPPLLGRTSFPCRVQSPRLRPGPGPTHPGCQGPRAGAGALREEAGAGWSGWGLLRPRAPPELLPGTRRRHFPQFFFFRANSGPSRGRRGGGAS